MIRSSMSEISEDRYKAIFRNKEKKNIKIEYKRNPDVVAPSPSGVTVVGENGAPIESMSSFHKNKIYKQTKILKEKLREKMCTKDECWHPTDRNINKMIVEMKNKEVQAYGLAMRAIGADPKECNTENLRR